MMYQYFLTINLIKSMNNPQQIPIVDDQIVSDPIRDYDYSKLYDPLTDPTRRVGRYEIPPYYLKQMIDIPTRGYPDSYSQFGVLVNKNKKNKETDNKILRLFGRQTYPGSSVYEYYIMINNGLDQIKLPLRTKRRNELYDGDKVFVPELGRDYTVNLHDFSYPRYYPDIL